VLYTEYLLYATQHHSPQLKIPITLGTSCRRDERRGESFILTQRVKPTSSSSLIQKGVWRELLKLFEEIKANQLADAYQIFVVMNEKCYFSYVSYIRPAPVFLLSTSLAVTNMPLASNSTPKRTTSLAVRQSTLQHHQSSAPPKSYTFPSFTM